MVRGSSVLPVVASHVQPVCSRWTFTQGFLLGQCSMIILAVLFLRYVVFEQPSQADTARAAQKAFAKRRRRASSVSAKGLVTSDSQLLSKIGYDLLGHPAEPTDWLNVLAAQALTGYRNMVMLGGTSGKGAKSFVETALNAKRAPEESSAIIALDHISVTDVDFGEEFPSISNARVRPSGEVGRVRVEFDVEYTDSVRLAVETRILVNFPRPRFAVLPVSLGLTLVKMQARLTVEIPPTPSPAPPVLFASLHPDFTLDLSATSLIGSRAKLQDIPKVEQLIVGRLRSFIVERYVFPRRIPIKLPSLSHHTAEEDEYVFVAESTPDDFGVSQHSAAPSTDDTSAIESDEDDTTARQPHQPDMDEVVRRPSPRSAAYMSGGSASALPSRIFSQQSPSFRHRGSASSASSGSESILPGALPKRMAPPPLVHPPPWRPGEHILRAGSRAMPLPSPSYASMSGMSSPGIGLHPAFREQSPSPASR